MSENPAQEVQEATAGNPYTEPQLDIAAIEQRLAIIKMRLTAVRAMEDNGAGIEDELAQLTRELEQLKEVQAAQSEYLDAIESYLAFAEDSAAFMMHRRTSRTLDFNDVAAAEQEIEANPAIIGFIPPEARINAGLREAIKDNPERVAAEIAENTIDAILGSYDNGLRRLARMAQDIGKALVKLKEKTDKAAAAIAEFINSPKWEQITAIFYDFAECFNPDNPDNDISILFLSDFIQNLDELQPYIEAELERLHKEKGVDSISFREFLRDTDPETGEPIKSLFEICIERANEARANKENGFDIQLFGAEDELAELEHITAEHPALAALLPTRHTMPNNALMNALQQKQPINAGEFDLVVSNATKTRKEITAYTMITYDEQAAGTALTAANLSEYERQVSDAVITLWIEANKQELPPVFTTDMIFRAMPGGGDKPSPQQRGAITKAIEKMRHLHITVDATEEMRRRGAIGSNEICEFDDFYLSAVRVTRRIKNGGQTVTAYKLHAEPVILTYSRMTKQILEVNAKHIEVRKVKDGKAWEVMPMTAGRQSMTGYMLRRISVMKRDKEKAQEGLRNYNKKRSKDKTLPQKPLAAFRQQSPVILFDTLFAEAGTATDNREMTRRNRDFCFDVLDYWKTTGLIIDYEPQKGKNKSITGILIEV